MLVYNVDIVVDSFEEPWCKKIDIRQCSLGILVLLSAGIHLQQLTYLVRVVEKRCAFWVYGIHPVWRVLVTATESATGIYL